MMALDAFLWLVLGLALQCQILFADQTSNELQNHKIVAAQDMSNAKDVGAPIKSTNMKSNTGNEKTSEWQQNEQNSNSAYPSQHALRKRFTDMEDSYDLANSNAFNDDIGLDGMYAIDPYGYYKVYAPDTVADSDFVDSPIDKRHNSRWGLINRKLAQLKGNNKRENEKRQDSRWLIIQNKLNQLHNRYSKRGIGRWKNNKWALEKYGDQ